MKLLLLAIALALLLAVSGSVVPWQLGSDDRAVASGIRQANHAGYWQAWRQGSTIMYWRTP